MAASSAGQRARRRGPDDHQPRQILTAPKPPLLWVLLDEPILDRLVGGWDVMGPQLERLLEVSRWTNVGIRIVPLRSGWHPGVSSSFKLMDVAGKRLVYTETTGGGKLLSGPEEVETFAARYKKIGAKALPEDISRDMIKATLEARDEE